MWLNARYLVAGLVLLSNVPATAQDPAELTDLQSLEAELPRLMDEADVPGLAIAVVRDGSPAWHRAFGVKDAGTGEAVTDDTIFEAASLSKPVFAYAVLRLAARGELDLDAPLWKTLPYERLEHDERARSINARLVLSHQTGLPNWGGTPLEMSFAPGERWSYSGEGYVFLQRTVEKQTGLDLDAFVRREVFEPLGMSHSSFVWRDAYDKAAATPHDHLGGVRSKNRPDANAAASLHTTASDYGRFVAAMLSRSETAEKLVRRMLEPQAQVRRQGTSEPVDHLHWGLGWGLQEGSAGRAFWHWGDNGTFRCYVVGYLETGDGLVYFTNSENGLSLARAIVSRVFPGDEHHALGWMGYEAYDDPARKLVLKLVQAFLDKGQKAGLDLYRKLSRKQPEVLDGPATERVARTLMDRDLQEEAIALLEANVERHPDLVPALHGLAQATLDAGRLEQAHHTDRKILKLAPDDERAPYRIAWAELGLKARKKTVVLPAETLQRYAGSYGPRQVTFEDGRLRYERQGRDSYWLTPLTEDTFGLDGLPTFRLRFAADGEGRIVKVEGLYSMGQTDATPRDR